MRLFNSLKSLIAIGTLAVMPFAASSVQAQAVELLGSLKLAKVIPPTVKDDRGGENDNLIIKVDKAGKWYGAQVILTPVEHWEAGDNLVLSIEARTLDSQTPGQGVIDVGLQNIGAPYTKFFRDKGTIGKEWTTLQFQIKGKPQIRPGMCQVILGFGSRAQRVELRRVSLSWDPTEGRQRRLREQKQMAHRYGHRTEQSPRISHVCLVAPDMFALEIEAQQVQQTKRIPYQPQPEDQLKPQKRRNGVVKWSWVIRDDKRLGRLHEADPKWIYTPEFLTGDPLLVFYADDAANFTISSTDHVVFAGGIKPVAVYRKSEPTNIALPGSGYSVMHRIYLKLPEAVEFGKHYKIAIDKLNVQNAEVNFTANLSEVRSESVHVNQNGYRPNDPVKQAFLSIWLGTGGGYTFSDNMGFTLIDDSSGNTVYEGQIKQVMAEDGSERLWNKPPKNYSQTAVYRMDFNAFNQPGRYRVYVSGVGCSYPFEIGDDTWRHAFLTQMKGLYTARSGVELGPPYTHFKRPADFHPSHGAVVTRSTYDVLKSGQFGHNVGQAIADGDTGEAISNAWGGYHDAGDWNPRRVTHMAVTLAQLELVELFPDYFNKLKLCIPPTEGVPDMITEALFEIDCFRRLQHDDGAIPFGIETEGDPLFGELSWLSNQHAYVLAPNIRDSWFYAAVAARAAKVLKPIQSDLAEVYLQSAIRAFEWAEKTYASMQKAGETFERKTYWQAFDARNLSSLILYDITDDQHYHDVFKQTTCLTDPNADPTLWGVHIQSDAMFLYARMDRNRVDQKLFKNARHGIRKLADRSLKYAKRNTFNITQREPGRPMFAGFFSITGGMELVRAHYLTGADKYLAGAVQSCQFQFGCNPNNLVYTTGLGTNPVKNPLELDARGSGQDVLVGLTVWGNTDYFNWPNSFWDMNLRYVNQRKFLWPDAYQWPLTEAYFDTWIYVAANEYVVDSWAPNVLVWGYLAARK